MGRAVVVAVVVDMIEMVVMVVVVDMIEMVVMVVVVAVVVVLVLVLVVVGTIVVAIVLAVVAELSTAKGTRSFKFCRYRQKKCSLCIILHFPQEEDGFRCSRYTDVTRIFGNK